MWQTESYTSHAIIQLIRINVGSSYTLQIMWGYNQGAEKKSLYMIRTVSPHTVGFLLKNKKFNFFPLI